MHHMHTRSLTSFPDIGRRGRNETLDVIVNLISLGPQICTVSDARAKARCRIKAKDRCAACPAGVHWDILNRSSRYEFCYLVCNSDSWITNNSWTSKQLGIAHRAPFSSQKTSKTWKWGQFLTFADARHKLPHWNWHSQQYEHQSTLPCSSHLSNRFLDVKSRGKVQRIGRDNKGEAFRKCKR